MPKRWAHELEVAHAYMQNVRAQTNGQLVAIRGDLVLPNRYSDGVRERFTIRIVYPPDFLHALTAEGFVDNAPTVPWVYLLSHRNVWVRRLDGHILSDWSLCLFVPGEADINFRDQHSLKQLLEVIQTFLILQRIYQARIRRESETGVEAKWPGPQRSHGLDGLLEAIRDRGGLRDGELCICGSGLRFARCHKELLEQHEQSKLQEQTNTKAA
jgi:hypothetical protein